MHKISIKWTHLCLVFLRQHVPHTMPTMSNTPRLPATTPPMIRPTAVPLMESVFTGQLFARGRMTVTVCTQEFGTIIVIPFNSWKWVNIRCNYHTIKIIYIIATTRCKQCYTHHIVFLLYQLWLARLQYRTTTVTIFFSRINLTSIFSSRKLIMVLCVQFPGIELATITSNIRMASIHGISMHTGPAGCVYVSTFN